MKNHPIITREEHERGMRRSRKWLLYTNLIMFLICAFLYSGWVEPRRVVVQQSQQTQQLQTYQTTFYILSLLRPRGISLSQGMDIAETLIRESRKQGIPLSLAIAVMQKESSLRLQAVSNAGAIGLMQVMPQTFEIINKNLNLGFKRSALYDPIVNIRISLIYLRDLVDQHKKKSKTEEEMWRRVLNSYSHNARGYPEKVVKIQKRIEENFREGV